MRLVVLIVALLLLPAAIGLGVTPAKITLSEAGDFSFTPLSETQVRVRVEGDLADLILLESNDLGPGDLIHGEILSLDGVAPGDHVQRIIIAERPSGGGTVSVSSEVAALLTIRVPRPGVFLTGDVSLSTDWASGRTLITVMLENLGSESVMPSDIVLDVSDGRTGETVRLTPVELRPQIPVKLQERHVFSFPPGSYTATLSVDHEEVFRISERVSVGHPRIIIDEVVFHTEERGDVIPLDVHGRLIWNVPTNITVATVIGSVNGPSTSVTGGPFSARLYVEGRPDNITVVVSALGVSNSTVYLVGPSTVVDETRWPWYVLALLILAWVVWRLLSSREAKSI